MSTLMFTLQRSMAQGIGRSSEIWAKIQGELRDLPRSCAELWLHEYHVIVYVNCVYCVIVIVNVFNVMMLCKKKSFVSL